MISIIPLSKHYLCIFDFLWLEDEDHLSNNQLKKPFLSLKTLLLFYTNYEEFHLISTCFDIATELLPFPYFNQLLHHNLNWLARGESTVQIHSI
jgi:hypothetical protein